MKDEEVKIIEISYKEIEVKQQRVIHDVPDHIPDEQIDRYIEIKKGGKKIDRRF